ncbi:putative amino acid ABC transporter, periplasmic amino acid-binding portion [Cellvibrio japonicus Ueda107]|uniref:Putative amino acid ABC transporter, periplasmic amino acid-binding portion n=2 Tax=Cellvibrio japonicus TaxID=155077 RepID=B3PBD3_CELJU|nr:putative amino acid ABC transporter, periplasmic amino acid-binding portion [Cellvibrio japonicus Ueda107]
MSYLGRIACGLMVFGACFGGVPVNASPVLPLHYFVSDGASEPFQIVSNHRPLLSPAPALISAETMVEDSVPLHSGVITDILLAALKPLETPLDILIRPYKRLKMEIVSQRFPRWISYGAPTWTDPQIMAQGEYIPVPIVDFRYTLTRMADGSPQPLVADIKRVRVIVILGYTYARTFYDWIEQQEIQLVYAPNHSSALAMLMQRRGDFYLAEDLRTHWLLRQNQLNLTQFHLIDFSSVIPPSQLFYIVDKNLPEPIKTRLQSRLTEMRDQGELEALIAPYR